MTEIRCVKCDRRLFDFDYVSGRMVIKCPKCGQINTLFTMGNKNLILYLNSKVIGHYEENEGGTGYYFKKA